MASELVRRVWCDIHAAKGEQVPAADAGEDVALRVGTLFGVVDLCEECVTTHLTPLAELVQTYARPSKAPTASPPKAPSLVCEVCGAGFGWRGSLRTHMKQKHGRALEQQRTTTPTPCPYCGDTIGSAAGLSMHIKSRHPGEWTGPKH